MFSKDKKVIKGGLGEKIILLGLMILLPLVLYAAMQMGASFLTWIIAGVFILSMGALIWLG